jgi:hypothetical protein
MSLIAFGIIFFIIIMRAEDFMEELPPILPPTNEKSTRKREFVVR